MTIALVPLKATSERTPGKNFKELAGKPLFRWVLDKLDILRKDGDLTGIAIYCDEATWKMVDPDIRNVAFLILEDKPNSYPEGNGFFYDMAHGALTAISPQFVGGRLMFCNATSPFVKLETYRACLNMMGEGTEFDTAVTAIPLIGRVWSPDAQALNHDPRTCPRTQSQKPCWIESEALWVMKPHVIMEYHRRVGAHPFFHPVNWVEQTDINYPEDFHKAETLLEMGVVKD